jgi:hypothetical protein
MNTSAFEFLALQNEKDEVSCAVEGLGLIMAQSVRHKGNVVKLRRTFNQEDGNGGFIKYWRVIQPGHPRNESDLSLEGLKDAGIVRWF